MAKKHNFSLFLVIATLGLLAVLFVATATEAETDIAAVEAVQFKTAAIIPCDKMIDKGLYESIRRRSQLAIDAGADYLIYDIDTYGGDLFAAIDITNHLLNEVNPKAHTVAYVSKKAISAGAMISVACNDIIMKHNTTIGDCAPIQLQGELEGVKREKIETFTRATFVTCAQANGYPETLLTAMVTIQIEVYKVKNKLEGKYEFFEGDKLPPDKKKYDLDNKELVVGDDTLLTLTAIEAKEYGIARELVSNTDEMLTFLAGRDGIEFNRPVITYSTNWSEELVRMLNHPTFTGILFMIGLLGVYIELKTPGLGLPGLVAVICFAILFGSRFLVGLATWWEVAMFIVGVILLLIEIFVIPGFGLAGITGLMFIFVSLFAILVPNRPDELPWPKYDFDWEILIRGAWGFGLGFVGFLIVAWILAKFLPKTRLFGGLVLAPAPGGSELKVNMTAPVQSEISDVKVGDVGEVLSPLRPTGQVRFGDAVVDVVAEGVFLEKSQKVEIIEIHGNRVVVKETKN